MKGVYKGLLISVSAAEQRPRPRADGVGAERAVGGISADDVARLAVAHEVDALLMDEQHGGSLDRLGGIRHVALSRRGDRMLDDPRTSSALKRRTGISVYPSSSRFRPSGRGFFFGGAQ